MSQVSPVCLLDASIYIFRYYFSLPDNWFSRDQGHGTGAVYGYSTFLLRLLEQERPSHIAACYDESLGQCFRNDIYPDYKVSRPHPDEALAFQLRACRRFGEILGIASFASNRYEADDLIGSLGRVVADASDQPIAILTRDKDLGQLIRRPQDFLWDHAADRRAYASDLEVKVGVRPEQLVDYLALVGDSIDDIPGVPGVGPKTAIALLNRFGDLEGIWTGLDEIESLPIRGAKTLAAKLGAHRDQVVVSRQLARIEESVPLDVALADLRWGVIDWEALEDFAEEMGFGERFASRYRRTLGAH